MVPNTTPSFPSRVIAPWPLLTGVLLSFLACCAFGRVAAGYNVFPGFDRFHLFIAPESQFFPTASQVRAVGRSRFDQDKIGVIVGGNSILQGVGQRPEKAFARKLQEELGGEYRVVNFAMRGAYPFEVGGTACEMLSEEYPKLLYVTNMTPVAFFTWHEDGEVYRYFFWDAYYKGLTRETAAREESLRELDKERGQNRAFQELKMGMRLDAECYSRDLWTTLAYQRFSTVWTPLVQGSFTKARQGYRDPEPEPLPLERRYSPEEDVARVQYIRGLLAAAPLMTARAAQLRDRAGMEGETKTDLTPLERTLERLPGAVRGRTLAVITRESPHYIERLEPAEQATYADLLAATAAVTESRGVAAQEIGKGYDAGDFIDHGHFSEDGARKMAVDAAVGVRKLARRLGYDKSGE